MELAPRLFYDTSKFTNTLYFAKAFLEVLFARLLFRNNSSRVIFASNEFCYRQRLNLLSANGESALKHLDLPFMNYFRETNWTPSTRPFALSPMTMKTGATSSDEASMIRFLNVQATFTATCHFSRDDEAQQAYEALLWLQQPSVKQFTLEGLIHNQTEISIPVGVKINNISFNPTYKETDWLQKQRIIPLTFTFDVFSVSILQRRQTAESSLPENDEKIYITNKVLLDFLSYKQDPLLDVEHIELEIDRLFTSDPNLDAQLTSVDPADTSVTVQWTYNPLAADLLQDNVRIFWTGHSSYVEVPLVDGAYTITGLEPGSQYTIGIWFLYESGTANKYEITIETTTSAGSPNLKGMIGYTW